MIVTVNEIARVAHEANRAYCQALGDDSQLPWAEAPDWQRESARNGVRHLMVNPGATPEQSHENWYREKAREGWLYGPVKMPERKEHPCMVPYSDLPAEQKAKDYIFRAVVRSMIDLAGGDA